MENPRLNFIDPRVLTDTKPSVLITHEMAHSWSGDMVTLGQWNDTWLNEGLASYLELRTLEPFASQAVVDASWANRLSTFSSYAHSTAPRNSLLHVPLTSSDDPNFMFNRSSYSKGALFFQTIEKIVGRDDFDRFLRDYFAHFAWHWVDDVTFLKYLRSTLLAGRPDVEASLALDEWVYQSGLPQNATVTDYLHNFQVAAPQTTPNSSASDDVAIVARTAPMWSAAIPANRLDKLMVSVTNP
jgi:leukotriene-A4 hydrolase